MLNFFFLTSKSVHTFSIALNESPSAGLGLHLKGPNENIDSEHCKNGLFIEKILHGGAAHKVIIRNCAFSLIHFYQTEFISIIQFFYKISLETIKIWLRTKDNIFKV